MAGEPDDLFKELEQSVIDDMKRVNSEKTVDHFLNPRNLGRLAAPDGLGRMTDSYGPQDLTIIVNTGDDFEQYGLYICPDLDTVCYTFAGLANPETGWGRVNETWNAIENAARLGGPDWFRIGDQDMGTTS